MSPNGCSDGRGSKGVEDKRPLQADTLKERKFCLKEWKPSGQEAGTGRSILSAGGSSEASPDLLKGQPTVKFHLPSVVHVLNIGPDSGQGTWALNFRKNPLGAPSSRWACPNLINLG